MPDHNALIAAATPVFFVLIALEAWWSRRQGLDAYRFADSLTSLGCGILTVTLEVFIKGALLFAYAWTVRELAPWPLAPSDWRTWALGALLLDFLYYWAHRWSHEVNLLWGGHAPHHQSEEYNLTTALRQGVLQDAMHMPVFLPMALLGFPPGVFITLLTLSKFYQFWIHTRVIERVPLMEGILNTPSAHRVHHAVNGLYLDRNYGGTLMLWDRLFGTWQAETEPCVYGVRRGMPGWNPLAAQTIWLADLWRDARRARSWRDRAALWWRPTGWRPADVARRDPHPPFVLPAGRAATATRGPRWTACAAALLVLAAALNQLLLARLTQWNWTWKAAAAAGVAALLAAMAWALRPASRAMTP